MKPPTRVFLALLGLLLLAEARGQLDANLPSDLPAIVCFPPTPPVFGDALPTDDRRARSRGNQFQPPEGLAEYVSEYFYPALSSRLYRSAINPRLQTRLRAYHSARSRLINELADQIVALHDADDETRETTLRTFAAQQTPAIRALEAEAEQLRSALIDPGIWRTSVDVRGFRKWRLSSTRFPSDTAAIEAEFQVMRAAAYYQDGLMPEQRGLLLELAMDLRYQAQKARGLPASQARDAAAMFFSPETSRLRLPAKMSAELAGKVGRYNGLKDKLKNELRSAIAAHDASWPFERKAALVALAADQSSDFHDLEKIADEIRGELAKLPPVSLGAPPYIPQELITRIEAYERDRVAYIRDFYLTLQASELLVEKPLANPRSTREERLKLAKQVAAERAEKRRQTALEFQNVTRERYEALVQRHQFIKTELTAIASMHADPETGRPLDADALLRLYTTTMEKFATYGREEVIYRGYRMAMLRPGLSPEQRRLLFGAALVGLAQPLPWGELLVDERLPAVRS